MSAIKGTDYYQWWGNRLAMMTRLSNDNPALSDDQFKKTVDDSDVDDISVTGVAKL